MYKTVSSHIWQKKQLYFGMAATHTRKEKNDGPNHLLKCDNNFRDIPDVRRDLLFIANLTVVSILTVQH